MTTMSTIVALFMMPFNVWLYGRSLESDTIVIPYAKMSSSLFILSAPVVGGMLVYWKFPKVAPILTKVKHIYFFLYYFLLIKVNKKNTYFIILFQIGSFSGFAIIIVCEALEVMIFPDIFDNVPSQIYVAEFVLPMMGMGLGTCACYFEF